MKERPILFSSEMVRAILAGRKTQTRRVVKPQSDSFITHCYPEQTDDFSAQTGLWIAATGDRGTSKAQGTFECPYGVPGDRLWVRETFYCDTDHDDPDAMENLYYMADAQDKHWCCELIPECQCGDVGKPRAKPGIHMPRWASRITLEIKEIRVERLQDISDDDCVAEGFEVGHPAGPLHWYQGLWNYINPKYPWPSNPWVWIITFHAISDETRAE